MEALSLRFIRWGAVLLLLGLLTGYGPLHHYMQGMKMSCPWAPVHAHVALLGWFSFTLFGLVYRILPEWGPPSVTALRLAATHFWVSVIGVLGVYVNGTFGYRYLDRIRPGFYYKQDMPTLRLWLSIDGGLLSLYGIGCVLFVIVLFGVTNRRKA